MPILDPSLQYFIINNDSKQKNDKNGYSFFLKYLQFASINIYRNLQTIEASYQFKKDLRASIPLVNELFECNITNNNDFENNNDFQNYYKYLFDHINHPDKLNESKKYIGTYKICNDNFHTKLYQPHVFYHEYHSWYFSDTPIAILSINSQKFIMIDNQIKHKIFQFIKLEIDLFAASDLTLVLCYNGLSDTEELLYQIIEDDQFSELHINIYEETFLREYLIFMNDLYFKYNKILKGFIYLYSYYFSNSKDFDLVKNFRKIPCTKVISFSLHPSYALKQVTSVPTKPFQHCKTGFNQNYLRIFLCFVPYTQINTEDKVEFVSHKTSFDISDLCIGYISPSKFLFNHDKKDIEVLFIDEKDQIKYFYVIKFDDIHLLRPDLFVHDTLALTQMDDEMHNKIDVVIEKVNNKLEDKEKLQKSYIRNIGHKDYLLVIRRVIYAYTYFRRQTNKNFFLRHNQIYAILEACHNFFDKSKSTNGCIYQIKTGEGKSCIVSIISAVLAIKKFIAHVVSSNIKLCNRDYEESYEFFKMLGLETAVLLHKNELPYDANKPENMIVEFKEKELRKKYPQVFYANELFNNPSSMNFSACGLDNDNNASHKANVIFSTFVNFECFYLHLLENSPAYIEKYFHKKCGLVIDEADSILIDEITNGTIISKEMNSNANEVLSLVYHLYTKNKMHNAADILNKLESVKLKGEIDINDVEQMIDDIKTVEEPNFGKKYVIETFKVKNKKRILNLIKNTVKYVKALYDNTIEGGEKLATLSYKYIKKKMEQHNPENNSYISMKKANDNYSYDYKEKDEFDGLNDNDLFLDEYGGNEEHLTAKNKKKQDKEDPKKKPKSKEETKNDKKKKKKKFHSKLKDDDDDDEEEEENDNNNNDDDDEEEDEDEDTSKYREFKLIFPFDTDIGIVERNKEFTGFIPQFISLKESKDSKDDFLFKSISMNYLYISHPIFANLYRSICGLTGTVGKQVEKTILSNQYKLSTKKIPRHEPNLRIEFPMIITTSIFSRNTEIVNEILRFHEKGNPVLVIFRNKDEINKTITDIQTKSGMVYKTKNFLEMYNINIFDGTSKCIKPDYIAGTKGAISFGTNICGRGTDIKCNSSLPLHVIIAYYTPNSRVMEQAFGRTARNGQIGTCRCICYEDDLFQKYLLKPEKVDDAINEVGTTASKQREFIEHYKKNRTWIFNFIVDKDTYKNSSQIGKLKELKNYDINVNRIVACNFKYSICMSYQTFLKIQAQKIFSIFNCPNCRYSWRIFQRYIREMILQSWSIMIDKFEKKRKSNLDDEINELNSELKKYLPDSDYDMISTFIHICQVVRDEYRSKIIGHYKNFEKLYRFFGDVKANFCYTLGFRPYELLSKSGARITTGNVGDTNYIQDPELSYERKYPDNRFSLLSITERIDQLFELLSQKISSFMSKHIALKFFLRRTLVGCEFGVCLDFGFYDEKISNEDNLLIDSRPLLVATIYVWSVIPVFAGILIIVLVYFAYLLYNMFENISTSGATTIKKILKQIASKLISDSGSYILSKISEYLGNKLDEQIKNLKNSDSSNVIVKIIEVIKNIFVDSESIETYSEYMGDNIKISINDAADELIDGPILIKIGVQVILIFICFIQNFVNNKSRLKDSTSDSKEYDSTFDIKDEEKRKEKTNQKLEKIQNRRRKEIESKSCKIEKIDCDQLIEKLNQIKRSNIYELVSNKYYKKLSVEYSNLKSIPIKYSKFCINKTNKKIMTKVYLDLTEMFYNYVTLFSQKIDIPILQFVGFVLNGSKSFLLFDSKLNTYSYTYLSHIYRPMKFKFNLFSCVDAFIFIYGIAYAMEFLEKNNVKYPILNPNNIVIYGVDDDIKEPYILPLDTDLNVTLEAYPELVAPEVMADKSNFSYKSNIYALGALVFIIKHGFSNQKPFQEVKHYITSNDKIDHLIIRCLNVNPDERPSFSEICDIIEKEDINYNKPMLYYMDRMNRHKK